MFADGGALPTQEKKKDLESFKEIPEILGIGGKVLRRPQNCKISAVNYVT